MGHPRSAWCTFGAPSLTVMPCGDLCSLSQAHAPCCHLLPTPAVLPPALLCLAPCLGGLHRVISSHPAHILGTVVCLLSSLSPGFSLQAWLFGMGLAETWSTGRGEKLWCSSQNIFASGEELGT